MIISTGMASEDEINEAVAAIAPGSCLIEKHLTPSLLGKGPDSEFSLEPVELEQLCTDTQDA